MAGCVFRTTACVSTKRYLTNNHGHLAKGGELQFTFTRAEYFIMLSPLDKTIWLLHNSEYLRVGESMSMCVPSV